MRLFLSIILSLGFFLVPGLASASKDRVFSLEVENDVLTPTDRNFTNGVRVSVAFGPAAQKPWMTRLADGIPFLAKTYQRRIIGFALGQNMYTPDDTTSFNLIVDDRPYAGWLYGEFWVEVAHGDMVDYFTLQVGVIGPVSVADRTQRAYHRFIGVDRPNGWDNQLGNEPGIVLGVQRTWTEILGLGGGFEVGSSPHLGAVVGNIYTYAAAGWTLRLGQNLGEEAGPPPRISPGLPGSRYFKTSAKVVWYFFAAVEGRAVARDIFLDGNTFASSHGVDKKNLVADFQLGAVLLIDGIRISYTHVFRTREFDLQPANHEFSGVNIAFRF